MSEALRHMPSVDQVLKQVDDLLHDHSHVYVVARVRRVVEALRQQVQSATTVVARAELLARAEREVRHCIEREAEPSLRRVVNATGVVLHTGLGRAPLPQVAREAVERVATGYCNLEFELETGKRGERVAHVEELICEVAGAEAAAVVNNNAAAVLLLLDTLARGREVVVSRGQQVEIGGSFRMPDIIAASGAQLREVGTTNRTHLRDYEAAVGPETGAILVVHPSNYKVQGFTAEVSLEDLAALGRRAGVPLVYDLGGGVLVDLAEWGLPPEPVVADALGAGADLVSFSGDKVLGGPQAGIIAGRRDLVEQVRANSLMRALRCDKLVYAALAAALGLYRLPPAQLARALPTLAMMGAGVAELEARAQRLVELVSDEVRRALGMGVVESSAQAGSGALPLAEIPSRAVALQPVAVGVETLARGLRQAGVVGRIVQERLLLDMRTVRDGEVEWVARVLAEVVGR
ncbi:MAG: L-seryl-tRNA(Sec) selenium transferase [Candidatus Latescibacterota bacterium]|nr:L-seryl-tRNA(Sec) selenium transferase [Candidatus Latescibacterota bacterium]